MKITETWQPKCSLYPLGTGPMTGLKGSSALSMICTMEAPQVLRSGCMMLAELPTPCTCGMQEAIPLSSTDDAHAAPFAASQAPFSGLCRCCLCQSSDPWQPLVCVTESLMQSALTATDEPVALHGASVQLLPSVCTQDRHKSGRSRSPCGEQ